MALGELEVEGDEKIAEEFNIEKLTPGGAEIEHKFIEHFFIDSHA